MLDVVEMQWFGAVVNGAIEPGLSNQFLVLPGFNMADGVSPILASVENLDETVWIGRGASPGQRMFQQWGLPVHYLAGYNREGAIGARASVPGRMSAAFCCGLETVPAADMMVHTKSGRHSVIFRYHSDLWGHARTPGSLDLGGRLVWTFGANFREAIRAYYLAVRDVGAIKIATPSAKKRAALTETAFSMWGAQLATGKIGDQLTQSELEGIYRAQRAAGLRMDTFLIEDRWESLPGSLTHDELRLPKFESFLQSLRNDQVRLSLWVTPLRCPQPAAVGLETRHLLRTDRDATVPILDVSQPEVIENISRRLRSMMKRYRPGFIKFDFGYEMPPLAMAAPLDMAFAGERLLLKAAEVLSRAVRAIDPDVVILYYGLSPFMVPFTDLTSPDDTFASAGDYDIEINRRVYFSSLLGELGMPTYGSGGYDWQSMPSIWFDTVLAGPMGAIADPRGDERGATPTPEMVALFNGLRAAARRTSTFTLDALPDDSLSPIKGARSSGWIRRENNRIVGVAMRHLPWMGMPGHPNIAGIVEADIDVVVTSLTDDDLTRSRTLALVPLGDGRVRVRRHRASEFVATEHYADGSTRQLAATMHDSVCVIDITRKSHSGAMLEWCALHFASN